MNARRHASPGYQGGHDHRCPLGAFGPRRRDEHRGPLQHRVRPHPLHHGGGWGRVLRRRSLWVRDANKTALSVDSRALGDCPHRPPGHVRRHPRAATEDLDRGRGRAPRGSVRRGVRMGGVASAWSRRRAGFAVVQALGGAWVAAGAFAGLLLEPFVSWRSSTGMPGERWVDLGCGVVLPLVIAALALLRLRGSGSSEPPRAPG